MAAPKTKIFVGHLPDGCKSEDLQALFAKYGVVKECDVINKYGFVHMNTPEEAEEAIKNLNNFNWMGSCISVEPSKSKLHPEPGAPGRAKTNFSRGGPARNGYGPRGGYPVGFSNGYRTGPPPFGAAESYYDRPFGFGRERMRPYPSPYDRRSPVMPPMRDDYVRRPMPPPPPGTADLYGRPIPPLAGREDLYERRSIADRSDYLYSRRSPPMAMGHRPYWYGDTLAGDSSGRTLATASRRPAYY